MISTAGSVQSMFGTKAVPKKPCLVNIVLVLVFLKVGVATASNIAV